MAVLLIIFIYFEVDAFGLCSECVRFVCVRVYACLCFCVCVLFFFLKQYVILYIYVQPYHQPGCCKTGKGKEVTSFL